MSRFQNCRQDFPYLTHYPNLAYLDNAATTQKPKQVIQAIQDYYEKGNANIHRGLYNLAYQATERYEAVRAKVAQWIGATDPRSIIYTSGTTESINLVTHSFLAPRLQSGDNILITTMEHHANLIPWQMLCQQAGAELRVIPLTESGSLDLSALPDLLDQRTRMMALVHVSNTLGTINPITEFISQAKKLEVPVLIDTAQSIMYHEIDVTAWDCDFLVFSGHKILGPTGVGILYGKPEHLTYMEPWKFGGDMIRNVTFEQTTFADYPHRFEAGTPNIAGVTALGSALDYLSQWPKAEMKTYVDELGDYARDKLQAVSGLRILGSPESRGGILSIHMDHVHPHDVATFLDQDDIAIRAGHHCTQPLMDHYGIPGTGRASFSIYNTKEEADRLAAALIKVSEFFG